MSRRTLTLGTLRRKPLTWLRWIDGYGGRTAASGGGGLEWEYGGSGCVSVRGALECVSEPPDHVLETPTECYLEAPALHITTPVCPGTLDLYY